MKRRFWSAVLFLSLLVDPMAGTFTYLHYRKTSIQKKVESQIKAGMEKSDLVLLQFSREEASKKLRWEKDKEFEYNGKMYDLVETIASGDTVYFWCWCDDEESALKRQLEDLAAQALGKKAETMANFTLLLNCYKSSTATFFSPWSIPQPGLKGWPLFLSTQSYSSENIRPPIPPPRLI